MAARLWAAFLALSILIVGGICSTAYAQQADLGRVAGAWVCTESGAMAALQAFTKSRADAGEVIDGPECARFPRHIQMQIVAIGAGPVEDFEGDAAHVVEVRTNQPVDKRFTIAWPGINAEFTAGQGA